MAFYKNHHHVFIFILLVLFVSCSNQSQKNIKQKSGVNTSGFAAPENGTLMFDGNSLTGWEITNFGTEGPVMVSEGNIVINMGDGASGITWVNDFPEINYEVHLEARKTVGNDFFCGITFPVAEAYCSFIVGGWGGPVLGLSCIDGLDASDNETRTLKRFDKNVWYKISLRVTHENISAWIDDEKLVDFDTAGRKLTTRPEVDLSKPFGICTWITTGELRNIWYKELD